MKAIQLTKPIRKAIEELGTRAKNRLYWEWIWGVGRTIPSGYALFAVMGHHETGRRIERRLWVHPTARYAIQIAEAIDKQIGAPDQLNQLRKTIDEYERYCDAQLRRDRWPR